MIVGITGGTGCGKTTALQAVRELGGLVLDCDAIYHDLLRTDQTLLAAIERRFPGTVENGVLQRKKLGNLVFLDENARNDLNQITHTAVKNEVVRRLSAHEGLAAIDAIALFESGLAALCDLTVAVCAPESVRVARLMQREDISRDYAQMRIDAQPPQAYFREICGAVLENDGTKAEFHTKCLAFFRQNCIMNVETPPES